MMLKDFLASNLKLPYLKGIQINYILDANADFEIARFIRDYISNHLSLLAINWDRNYYCGINSKLYINAFSKAVSKISKEIFFACFVFNANDLQSIVKAAHNIERIIFCNFDIQCSPGLNFGADLIYNTKCLSFQWWGTTTHNERKSDWKADPSFFSLIIDAIGSSGLRTSLEKIDIAWKLYNICPLSLGLGACWELVVLPSLKWVIKIDLAQMCRYNWRHSTKQSICFGLLSVNKFLEFAKTAVFMLCSAFTYFDSDLFANLN